MKAADMLIQAEHVSKWLDGRNVAFIGDGDALGLCLIHLHAQGELAAGPRSIHVFDFDERVVNSVVRFAERYGYAETISATLYNVADPFPTGAIATFGAFYTNPPFGGSNDGVSVRVFLRRGIEACGSDAICCTALADDPSLAWADQVLGAAQCDLLEAGFVIAEQIPRLHGYHLDDDPDLRSCSVVARRGAQHPCAETSAAIDDIERTNFYGRHAPLAVRYVRDLTNGGKLVSRDHENEPFPK